MNKHPICMRPLGEKPKNKSMRDLGDVCFFYLMLNITFFKLNIE